MTSSNHPDPAVPDDREADPTTCADCLRAVPEVDAETGECRACYDRKSRAVPEAGSRGLRAAARAVVNTAEPDDDFDGQFIEYLVPFAAIDALRAALAATPETREPVAEERTDG